MKLSKHSATLLVAGSMAFGAAQAATTITLDPAAANGDAANKTLCGPSCLFPATVVSSIQTSLTSILDISSASGSGSWNEAGSLVFSTFNGGATSLGVGRAAASGATLATYDVYGIFAGSGVGGWGLPYSINPNQFSVTGITNFTILIYGSPYSGTKMTAGTPSSGTDPTGGITQGSKDFLLGTATFAGSFGGTNAQVDGAGNATTQLTAQFNFAAASPAYTGIGGFFQAPIPFVVDFNGSGSANAGQATYVANGAGIRITTGNGATGNLTPVSVPEPSALALAGLALVAGAAVTARKKAVKG